MSFRVLVIPEDPTHNGYILRPLARTILADVGRPAAKVEILTNPKLRGYDQAVRAIREELKERYRHWNLWLFFPDADRASPDAMRALEKELTESGIALLCCSAQPEVEAYACCGYSKEIPAGWEQARRNARFKEEVFAPLLARHGDARRAGGGRDLMIDKSLGNLERLYQHCPEIKDLRDRIARILEE